MRPCYYPPCEREVRNHIFMCREHWFVLPMMLRKSIFASYNLGQESNLALVSDRYKELAHEAVEYLRGYYDAPNAG